MNQYMSRNQSGVTATPTAALYHTLQRHNEILQDYMQEFTRTKVMMGVVKFNVISVSCRTIY